MDEDLHLPEKLPVKNPNSSRNSSQIQPAQREGIEIKNKLWAGCADLSFKKLLSPGEQCG